MEPRSSPGIQGRPEQNEQRQKGKFSKKRGGGVLLWGKVGQNKITLKWNSGSVTIQLTQKNGRYFLILKAIRRAKSCCETRLVG